MNLNPESILIPYLKDEEIWEQVEAFRNEFIGNYDFPVDIEYAIESVLDISIIPTANIEKECSVFALLQSDLSAIRVDEQIYYDNDYLFKYRSDLSHEVAHWYMHKDIYLGQTILSPIEWIEFITSIPPNIHSRFEYQAYEFAGRLLVPRQALVKEIVKQESSILELYNLNKQITPTKIAPYLVNNLTTKFEVSRSVIEKRIVKERILEKYLA